MLHHKLWQSNCYMSQ